MHLNLPETLTLPFTSLSSSKNLSDAWKMRWSMLPWSLLQPLYHPRAHSQVCVCVCHSVTWDFSSVGMMPDIHGGTFSSLSHIPSALGTWSRCWALVSASPLLNLHLRFYQRNHSDLSQQDFLNQQRRGRVWAVLHTVHGEMSFGDTENSTQWYWISELHGTVSSSWLPDFNTNVSCDRKYKGSDVSSAWSFCVKKEPLIFFDRHRTQMTLSYQERGSLVQLCIGS